MVFCDMFMNTFVNFPEFSDKDNLNFDRFLR